MGDDRHRARNRRNSRYEDDYGDDYGDGYGYSGGGGLFSGLDKNTGMLILVGIGFLCWKGIIPVQNMSWFQLYMLWNIIEPLLLGGRGRRRGYGGGFGGMGMRGMG